MRYVKAIGMILFSLYTMHDIRAGKKNQLSSLKKQLRTMLKSITVVQNTVQGQTEYFTTNAGTVTGDLIVQGNIINSSLVYIVEQQRRRSDKSMGCHIIMGTIDTTEATIISGVGFEVQKVEGTPGTVQIVFNGTFAPNCIPTILLTSSDSNNIPRLIGVPSPTIAVVSRVTDGVFQFIAIGDCVC